MGMDQRQRRREGSRRAQASRARRQATRKSRQTKNILYGLGGLVAIAAVVAVIVFLRGLGPDIGVQVAQLSGLHQAPYIYNTDIDIDGELVRIPPTSGNHFPAQSAYGHIGGPLRPEAVVHNMEHGAAVIWYQPDNPDIAGQVNQLVNALGNQCLVAGSFANMDFLVAATVWGRVMPLREYDEAQLREFIDAYRGNEGPEAGLCRGQS